jgi:hypothetical protein
MKSIRISLVAGFLFSVSILPIMAQTISAADAKNHIGQKETVCGLIAGKKAATQSQGSPTFVDLDKPYPNQTLVVLVWERDKGAVGSLPGSGQICVTGIVTQYHGGAEIVLRGVASWYVPKAQSAPSSQLSNDNHYTNSDGQQVHSPAYSSGGVPANATAICGDGTYSFSQHRSGTCSHHGGVAKWL